MEVTVQFEARPAGGKGSHKDVGFVARFHIVTDVGVDKFHDILSANAESRHVKHGIEQVTEQMRGAVNGHGAGLVLPFAEFAPKAV